MRKVVTAPTNGAAGIIRSIENIILNLPKKVQEGIVRFF